MIDTKGKVAYFLGANSAEGFVSLYDNLIEESTGNGFYVLKGGAGCGKSTMMKTIGREMEAQGSVVEYILCSGDPDSLDGIYLPEKKVALVDGTSPHVMEPSYTGVLGYYINLGDCYDREKLRSQGEDFVAMTRAYQSHYPLAYQCLRAAKELGQHGEKEFLTEEALEKLEKRCAGIISREVKKKKGKPGQVKKRFLGAISCEGEICLYDTIFHQRGKVYELQDFAGLASVMLGKIRDAVVQAGYDVILYVSPLDTGRLAHLEVPELGLAFVTTTGEEKLDKRVYRRVKMETFVDRELLKVGRSKMKFAHKMALELAHDGVNELKKAKIAHDILEERYHPYVDFQRVDEMTKKLLVEISSL